MFYLQTRGGVSGSDKEQTIEDDILFSNHISACELLSNMECCHQVRCAHPWLRCVVELLLQITTTIKTLGKKIEKYLVMH